MAVVATNTEGNKETGFGSIDTCKAFYEALMESYQRVTFHEVATRASLDLIVRERPDLVVLCSKYLPETGGHPKIWFSEYFAAHDIAFTGSDRETLEFDSNKSKAKTVLLNNGIATAKFFLAHPDQFQSEDQLPLPLPLFIKPLDAANGNGIDENSIARDFESYRQKIAELFLAFGAKILVEELLPGREFTVAVLDNRNEATRMVMPLEIIPPENCKGDRTLGCDAKKKNDEVLQLVEEPLVSEIKQLVGKAFSILGAQDFGRIDVKLDALGQPHFIEANLVPGMTPDSSYFPRACILNNTESRIKNDMPTITHSDIARKIVELALNRAYLVSAV
ncbi:hypothetical protein WH96_03965 [Kiloniella spongiae]|uniref:ATP-grasp domain-containing protein n=1 Tax=Kiloniella spongiae TaxID=1489064 RepID=A0A0H2MMG5_9PROT|nr:hypothetical protein WH96_03965 [Kiloniella spongiae]